MPQTSVAQIRIEQIGTAQRTGNKHRQKERAQRSIEMALLSIISTLSVYLVADFATDITGRASISYSKYANQLINLLHLVVKT